VPYIDRRGEEITMKWTGMRRLTAGAVCTLIAAAGLVAASSGPASGTPSSGQTVDAIAAGHLPVRFKLDTKGPVDLATLRVTVDPGGTTGWHSHGGAVVVTVVSGTATLYQASHSGCAREVVPAGQAFWEAANLPSHVLVNEGTEPTVVYATFFLSDGAAPIIDAPRPPACAGIG
jgi:quercetin dioxygenase-like cupin family protein